MTNPFDADTALEGAGGRWRARVKEHWFVQRGPNGGLVAALATRALTEIAGGDGLAPRSLSLHYLAPPVEGELEVRAAVERAGRTTTFASIRVLQDGVTVAYGLGCCSAWREDQPEWDVLERPDVPPPGEIASLETNGEFPFLSNYEMRPLSAPHNGAWMRAAEPRPADPVLLAALTDAWIPAAFAHMEHPNFVPTIDLTIHWRAAPGVPAETIRGCSATFSHPPRRRRDVGGGRRAVERGRRPARPVAPARDRPAPAVTRTGHLGLGSNVGDRRAQPPGRGRRAARATACASSPPPRSTTPSPSARCSTSRSSSTRSCGSRRSSSPEALLDACKAVERSSAARRAACGTGPGRSMSTCCCWATSRSRRSA